MSDHEEHREDPLEYMEELSRAYREAFRKRLEKGDVTLSPEKREGIARMQWEIARIAERLRRFLDGEEKKELCQTIGESAEEILTYLRYREEDALPTTRLPAERANEMLIRCVLLANRSLTLLLRHTRADERLVFLVLSETSALYALASIR